MKKNLELEAQIEQHVMRPEYRPVKPRVIAKKLGIAKEDIRIFKRSLKNLIRTGKLAWGSKHLVTPPSQSSSPRGEATGIIRITAKGFGVVKTASDTPHFGGVDVHIPARSCLDAASGDRVRIRITRKRPGRDIPFGGRVEEVLERKTHTFVGTYSEEYNVGYVKVDGTQWSEPIVVGDAAARNCRPGEKVVIEMVRFPTPHREGEAVITEVLGPQGKPGVDTQLVIHQYGLPTEFPQATMDAARKQADQFDESISGTRVDLTEETIITIDPKDARDFDDAISLKRTKNGHWMLGVHIADVSHFVRPNTPLDDEAYRRGTSVYLPDQVIPMLPEIISNNLASLQPDRVRYAMTCWIEFTEDGARVHTDIARTAIRSKRRFTYEEVDDFLARPLNWRNKLTPEVFSLLENMYKLAMKLRSRRKRDGAIELHLPEVKIQLDGQGKVSGAKAVENTESHQIIEEFMLAANEAVAGIFVDRDLPFLRRVHPKPDPKKLEELTSFVRGLHIKCDSLVSRFEIQRLVESVRGLPQQQAVNFALLRSMSKAKYSPEEDGHYALGSPAYCHFTSPIRRYPDLVIHRMLGALIDGQKPSVDRKLLARIGDDCSAAEENAERAERDLIKLKLLGFFADRIGLKMPAVITGVRNAGFFVQGVELPVEGFVNARSLPPDRYKFDPRRHALTGHRKDNDFQLGDPVYVRISKVDLERRELDFVLDTSRPKPRRGEALAGTENLFAKGAKKQKHRGKGKSKTKPAPQGRGQHTKSGRRKKKRRMK